MLSKFLHIPVVSVLVLSGMTACQNAVPESSKLTHATGHPVATLGAWNWQDQSIEEYIADGDAEYAKQLMDDYLPLEHPLTQHLLARATTMFDTLVATYPEAMAHVPRPQVIVSKSSDFNAYATAKTVCL